MLRSPCNITHYATYFMLCFNFFFFFLYIYFFILHRRSQRPACVFHITDIHSTGPVLHLVTQAVAGLPDFDYKAQKREDEIHLNPKRLLLDNPSAMHLFGELSEGEKVLALHKTFHHLGEVVSVSCNLFFLFLFPTFLSCIVSFHSPLSACGTLAIFVVFLTCSLCVFVCD